MQNEIESKIITEMKNRELETKLLSYAKSLTNCLQSAEDLVQNARKKIREKKETIEWNNITGLLTIIIRNEYINQYRKNKNHPHKHIEEASKRDNISKWNIGNDAEDNFAIKVIEAWLQKLDKKDLEILELYMYGKKYEEISKEIDIPLGTVKARIFYARKKLAEDLSRLDSSYETWKKRNQKVTKKYVL